MENKPFDHGFTEASMKAPQALEVVGYNRALTHILDYLKQVTGYKPENRFIDSVPLLEKITATANDISKYYETVPSDDDTKVNILTGVKP